MTLALPSVILHTLLSIHYNIRSITVQFEESVIKSLFLYIKKKNFIERLIQACRL